MSRHHTKYQEQYPVDRPPLKQRIMLAPLGRLLSLMARLPARATHLPADALAWLAHNIVKYRRRIVRRNLADTFPHLTEAERLHIEKQFYRNLADYIFQTVALTHISDSEIRRRMTVINPEVISDTLDSGRDIVLYTSHFGNWEYITSLPQWTRTKEHVLYSHVVRPLKNPWFDYYFHRLRTRYNVSVPMRSIARAMAGWRRDNQRFIIGFLSDQKPGHYTRQITVEFLGRQTPFIAGTEDLARHFHAAVFYTDVRHRDRDTYTMEFIPMAEDAASLPAGQLTADYARLLTQSIHRDPAAYLWSHNRWRLKKEEI